MQTLELEELTIYTAAKEKANLVAFLATGDDLEINLANVEEIDTAGLQLLIMIKREAARQNKKLSFVLHSQAVLDILELANLSTIFGDQLVLSSERE